MKNRRVAKKEKFNIRPWLITLAIVFTVLAVTALTIFFENYHHIRKISYDTESDVLYDKRHDVTYVRAPECYEPVRLSKNAYAKYKEQRYYQLGYLDADGNEQLVPVTDMLATSKENGSAVYYNPDAVSLPELKDFKANVIFACNYYNTLDELSESETRVFIESYFKSSEATLTSADEFFTLRLRSKEYPHLSYRMNLFWENDLFYVEDVVTKKTVKLPANAQRIFDKERLSLLASGESK